MKKTELAAKVGVTRRAITAFESGDLQPGEETLKQIAEAVGFPTSFFSLADPPEISPNAASFRSLSRMTAGRRTSVLAAGSLAMEVNSFLVQRFSLPAANLPDLRDEEPDSAAAAVRSCWHLGERPIANMVHLLEAHGVRVYSLAEECTEVDAFSVWHGDQTPFVFLNTKKSGERGRFDAAHELGHLVLHRHGVPQGRETEAEADQFASAFLMPPASIMASAPQLPTVNRLLGIKQTWKVSMGALARRLYDLKLMSRWHYDSVCIEISKRGWRQTEPSGIPRETSQLLHKTFAALREDQITYRDVAHALHLAPSDIDDLVFGLLLHSIEGHGRGIASGRGQPSLRLVRSRSPS